MVQEVPGIYCLLVEGLVDLQGQPLGRLDDALDVDGIDDHRFLLVIQTPVSDGSDPLTGWAADQT